MARSADDHSESWGKALLKSTAIVVAAVGGFVVIPNELLGYLPLHGVGPRPRDAIVAASVTAWFVATSIVFVKLQGPRGSR